MARFTGGCLCGAVRYESSADATFSIHCHCVDCRKSSGTGHGSHLVAPIDAVTVTGKLNRFEKPADSGNMVTRCFCPTCGSPIYATSAGMPQLIAICAASLDDPEVFQPQIIVYDSRRPTWDATAVDLPRFPAMPPPQAT